MESLRKLETRLTVSLILVFERVLRWSSVGFIWLQPATPIIGAEQGEAGEWSALITESTPPDVPVFTDDPWLLLSNDLHAANPALGWGTVEPIHGAS